MPATILIVEDEPDLGFLLRANFKKVGYDVLTARSAETGLTLARRHGPALVLSDIMLPRMSGLEMLRELRLFSSAPVLFLTAKKDEIDRILGLKLGAADYVTKPFSIEELRLRVEKLLRRGTRPSAPNGTVRVGGVEIDLERHEVRVNGRVASLSPGEFSLLKTLVEADGKVLSREQLAAGLGGDGADSEPDPRAVDQNVARLRGKLEPERGVVATVSGLGYQIRRTP
ncbi:MAG TPA: response regulator transcription factor [Elusimicrobiota bacterium]|jgi:DNA-binding response OmpR family regulator|nr:response regulator transcription factor [Elusimicrobiota bacterium]